MGYGSPHVGHCPRLGDAALRIVVLRANENQESCESLHKTRDAERDHNARLVDENEQLKLHLQQAGEERTSQDSLAISRKRNCGRPR